MASGIDKLAKQIAGIIKKDEQTKGYDTTATVTRIDGGIAWVHIPGGVDETPVKMTVNAKAGDSVQVRVSGGRAFLVGNGSAPPTDDSGARAMHELSSRAIKAVSGVADKAFKIAGNTAQYFWTTETGNDTGAHITEIPKEQFLAAPENGGANLLLRSIGIAIRQGLIELASFSSAGLHVSSYDGNGDEVTIAHLGYGQGNTQSGTPTDAPYYTLGTRKTGAGRGAWSAVIGKNGEASGEACYSEGVETKAGYYCDHAEGYYSVATGPYAHAQNQGCQALNTATHAGGVGTKALSYAQTVIGMFNEEDANNLFAFIVGKGTADNARSNAYEMYWNGNTHHAGTSTTATKDTTYITDGSITLNRRGNMVQVSADITVNALTARTTVATIPVGYRPITTCYAMITSMSEYLLITHDGKVQLNAGSAGRRWFSACYVCD